MNDEPFWGRTPEALLRDLGSGVNGLDAAEAAKRLEQGKANRLHARETATTFGLLAAQFKNPITMLMTAAAVLSIILGENTEGALILIILGLSGFLGFWQERRAAHTIRSLLDLLKVKARVVRNGKESEIALDEAVPGDVAILEAGSSVPGDALILESRDLFVDESPLTGESFPVEKRAGPVAADAGPHERTNSVFLGTHVASGMARVLIAAVGTGTEFGKISRVLTLRPAETSFEHGTKHFGYLLLEVALVLSLVIFSVNVALDRPVLQSLLFTLALTVGLTPQLLPAIQGLTMARGAGRMAKKGVIVRRLSSIEDFGAMTVLCTDKTGTLTMGMAGLKSALDPWGKENERIRLYAYLNSSLQSGYSNPIDEVLKGLPHAGAERYRKTDEVPYDFARRRLSVAVAGPEGPLLITKGALDGILGISVSVSGADGRIQPMAGLRTAIEAQAEALGAEGCRCLGVGYRSLAEGEPVRHETEREMVFLGLLVFVDPIKPDAVASLALLRDLGVGVKMITGDNRFVAARIASQAGLRSDRVLTGGEMRTLNSQALARRAPLVDVYAEMDPGQKERVIIALRKAGETVGYLGDGINDASALHAADVGISVESAVDVTKQAADIVLMRKDLGVLADGVVEGRRAFANTLKYVFITTSANFGNMFSMAGASLFATFLPMLPRQVLFLNLLTDLPAMAIASDDLDPEQVRLPRRWNNREIRHFMIVFGLISSCYDFLTFGTLLAMKVPPAQFRTAWFLESVLSELMILLIIRTQRWSFKSKVGKGMLRLCVGVAAVTLAIPYLPHTGLLGFTALPAKVLLTIAGILMAYGLTSELAKRPFYRKARI
ncbi:MAG: putative magnesium-transporting P-type ATPase [Fibrobacteres bacterium]|nr:putative magnesium-transporting P-type ATPase [Fibrobacterota bacterium]